MSKKTPVTADATLELLKSVAASVREPEGSKVDIEKIAKKLGAARIEPVSAGGGLPGALQAAARVTGGLSQSLRTRAPRPGPRKHGSLLSDHRWRQRVLGLLWKGLPRDTDPYLAVEDAVARASGNERPHVRVILLDDLADQELDRWLARHPGAWQVPKNESCE